MLCTRQSQDQGQVSQSSLKRIAACNVILHTLAICSLNRNEPDSTGLRVVELYQTLGILC